MSTHSQYLPPCVPLPVEENELIEVVDKAKDWAVMHGAAMRSKTNFNGDTLQFAPFILVPSTFRRQDWDNVVEVQIVFNELVHKVAHDKDFLSHCLKDTIKVDDFTNKLFNIYTTVENEGGSAQIPNNNALLGLCQGMLDAWMIYGDSKAVILFIVEEVTYNICDQRFHEFEIRRLNPNVKVIRRTLTEIGHRASLASNKELVMDNFVVSVVYFRSGYEPNQYPTNLEWDARLLIERSKAIKCPTIQYHLAGTKKVQQELSKPGAVERFIRDPKKVEVLREFFVGLYGLGFDELGDKAVEMALKEPERFVLKPQREGGGNNIYGSDIKEALSKMKDNNERMAWILMERIFPPIIKGYMIRPGGPQVPSIVELVSELGIYGVVIGDSQNITVNRQVGHMLRTKISTANEGGVAAGLGALDSPYLID